MLKYVDDFLSIIVILRQFPLTTRVQTTTLIVLLHWNGMPQMLQLTIFRLGFGPKLFPMYYTRNGLSDYCTTAVVIQSLYRLT